MLLHGELELNNPARASTLITAQMRHGQIVLKPSAALGNRDKVIKRQRFYRYPFSTEMAAHIVSGHDLTQIDGFTRKRFLSGVSTSGRCATDHAYSFWIVALPLLDRSKALFRVLSSVFSRASALFRLSCFKMFSARSLPARLYLFWMGLCPLLGSTMNRILMSPIPRLMHSPNVRAVGLVMSALVFAIGFCVLGIVSDSISAHALSVVLSICSLAFLACVLAAGYTNVERTVWQFSFAGGATRHKSNYTMLLD